MRPIRRHLTFANVTSFCALFIVLTGGTAVALTGSNTVQSDDLGPGAQVKAADVAANAVGANKVINDTLTGADVNESSLGQVPSALLGGFGRSASAGPCNPESDTFIACAVVTRNLPSQARLLLVAQATAAREGGEVLAQGNCRIGTTSGPLLHTETFVTVDEGTGAAENLSLVGVTDPFPPGQHSFGIDCNEQTQGIIFFDPGITAVAISPD